jgi:predicted DNA-binding protein YlxM (UPF0122 family)
MENTENERRVNVKSNKSKRLSKAARTATDKDANRVKRKRVVLNFVQRQAVIEKLKKGLSHDKIAEEFNIGKSTLCEIGKRADESLVRIRAENSLNTEKKVFKTASFPMVDNALKLWYYQERAKGSNTTHTVLAHKVELQSFFFFFIKN